MAAKKMLKWSMDLPDWASWGVDNRGDTRVDINPDVVYPKFFGIIKKHVFPELDIEHPTQNLIQIATWVIHRRLKKLMYADGKNYLRLHIERGSGAWAMHKFPFGDEINKRTVYNKLGLDKIKVQPEPEGIDW